ncbi:maleylpyruvate isomerase family mycothiol-dependent enzyme [Janibacter sp. GS2]|uniref:maleylpyruvate isomerase family mycothiol-dependent enzyme n=1 Tax=Janibacter sp. GS2 TaxID=3442646 RepID=UPI003EB86D6B
MTTMNTDTVWAATRAERRRLVATLEGITPADWDAASLCAGWRVREVVAHLSLPYRYSGWAVARGLLGARGSFARFADRAARSDAAVLSDAQLLQALASNVEHPWRPPGGGPVGALSHDVIHGLDITEPLALEGPPVATIRHVLDGAGPRNLKFFGVDLHGHRLQATDTDWQLGEGDPVRLTAKEILLVITARTPLPGR